MTNHLFFIDGKKIASDVALKLPDECDLMAFESIRCYEGIPFRLKQHLDRLFESAKDIGLKLPKTRVTLQKEVFSCLKNCKTEARNTNSFPFNFLRLAVDKTHSYILLLNRTRKNEIYERGVTLVTSVTRRDYTGAVPPEAKTNAFFNCVLAQLDFLSRKRFPDQVEDVFDTIFLDGDGFITEALSWNLFIVKNGRLLTPASGILRGVTRQFVLECAVLERIPTQEINLSRHEAWNADEMFLTNTSGEIVPVRALDGRKIGREIPGKLTVRLHKRFQKEVANEIKLQHS